MGRARTVIDKAGRVVIPKSLREPLRVEPGDTLEMESTGEQITLRPVSGTSPLTKEHGVWVFHSGQPLPASETDDMLQQIREERDVKGWQERVKAFPDPSVLVPVFYGDKSQYRSVHTVRKVHRLLWSTQLG